MKLYIFVFVGLLFYSNKILTMDAKITDLTVKKKNSFKEDLLKLKQCMKALRLIAGNIDTRKSFSNGTIIIEQRLFYKNWIDNKKEAFYKARIKSVQRDLNN